MARYEGCKRPHAEILLSGASMYTAYRVSRVKLPGVIYYISIIDRGNGKMSTYAAPVLAGEWGGGLAHL